MLKFLKCLRVFNLKVFLEFVLISADDSGATEAVAECRILLALSPYLRHLSPAGTSGLHLCLHNHLFEEESSVICRCKIYTFGRQHYCNY